MRRLLRTLLLVLVAGCGSGTADDSPAAADTLTRDQRDSIIGESGLPGAKGVTRARDASRAGDARAAQLDSLQQ